MNNLEQIIKSNDITQIALAIKAATKNEVSAIFGGRYACYAKRLKREARSGGGIVLQIGIHNILHCEKYGAIGKTDVVKALKNNEIHVLAERLAGKSMDKFEHMVTSTFFWAAKSLRKAMARGATADELCKILTCYAKGWHADRNS